MTLSIAQRILNATASESGGPYRPVPRRRVAALCGFARGEPPSYRNQIGILNNKKSHIIADKDTIMLTDDGWDNAAPVPFIQSNRDAFEQSKKQLKGKSRLIYEILTDGRVHTRASIAERIGHDHTLASYKNMISPLKSLGFAEYVAMNGERALRMLDSEFVYGRPSQS